MVGSSYRSQHTLHRFAGSVVDYRIMTELIMIMIAESLKDVLAST